MIDLCFNESAGGGLKIARLDSRVNVIGGNLFFFTAKDGSAPAEADIEAAKRQLLDRQAMREARGGPIPGHAADVLCLSLFLDVGDIAGPVEKRMEVVRDWFLPVGLGTAADAQSQGIAQWERCMDALSEFRRRAAYEPVRVWVDDTPESQCGLRFVAEALMQCPDVRIIQLPAWRMLDNGTVVSYNGWGEVSPMEFSIFLDRAVSLPQNVLRLYAGQWRQLQSENAPLRAMVNGNLMSVDEDFYDPLIRRTMPDAPCRVAQLIGDIIGRHRPRIGDAWLARRIRVLLDTGVLEFTKYAPEMFYSSVIQRGKDWTI